MHACMYVCVRACVRACVCVFICTYTNLYLDSVFPQAPTTKGCSKESQTESSMPEDSSRKINELVLKIQKLENDAKSSRADLECERHRSKQLLESVQRKEEEKNQRVLRTKSVVAQIPENDMDRGRGDNGRTVDLRLSRNQAHLIKSLQETIEHERQERKELVEKVTRETQKNKEKEFQQLLKRAVNKERLDRERAVEEAVKRAVEKTKQDSEKLFQRALVSAKEEAERSMQEAVASMKRKQWCAHCGNEAFYPCCWNTSYCTLECQKTHWFTHKYQCVRVPCNCGQECSKR